MPRAARIDIPNLHQHVIVRGVDRCDIFRDDADRSRFLQRLSELLVQTGTECLAWALMTNHVHLLLCPRETLLAPLMRRLLTGYAIYFNRRHGRSGHLFQNRYKSIVCDEEAYLLELVRYIHLNPLRAGLVENLDALGGYSWSGHAVLLGKRELEGQVVDGILTLFGKRVAAARKNYCQFVADGISQGKRADLTSSGRRPTDPDASFDSRILGDGDFIETLCVRSGLATEIPPKISIDELIIKVCQAYRVDPELLQRKTRVAGVAETRSVVCYLAVRKLGLNGVEVGAKLGLSRSGVSIAAGRGEQLVKEDPAWLKLID